MVCLEQKHADETEDCNVSKRWNNLLKKVAKNTFILEFIIIVLWLNAMTSRQNAESCQKRFQWPRGSHIKYVVVRWIFVIDGNKKWCYVSLWTFWWIAKQTIS